MESALIEAFKGDDLVFYTITAAVAAIVSLAVFAACFWWYRREQRRLQKQILNAMAAADREPGDVILTGSDASAYGELIAQFKMSQGKRVVSLLESDGRRFIHVDGELSIRERAQMVRYLKSEGFMS